MNAVQLDGVQQHYGRTPVLQDFSLNLAEGEVLGLFGHNGAGKTTSMRLILGLLQPTQGTVRVLGKDAHDPQVRRQLGYLPENVMFYPQLTGRETLTHFARLKHADARQVDELLSQVGLRHAADRRVKTYSKGMRQRLGLAQALLGSPRLLLLDEPTVGLDPIATQDLYGLIDRLRQGGTSIILCSHVLPGVEPHIDRAAILAQGRLQSVGTLTELREGADLPTRIRALGLAQRDQWLQRWTLAGYNARPLSLNGIEITTGARDKMGLVRELLTQAEPADLEIQQPTLEDLYRYFMDRVEAGQSAGATA